MLKSICRFGRQTFRLAAFGVCFLATVRSGAAASPGNCPKADSIKTLEKCTLQVCLYPGFKPFTSWEEKDPVWRGWDVVYLKAFAKSYGLTFKEVKIEAFLGIWKLPGGERKACDIAAAGISDLPDRRAESPGTTWSKTYYTVDRAYLVRDGDTLDKVEDLAGKKVTVIVTKGSTADTDLQNRLRQARKAGVKVDGVTVGYTDQEAEAAKMVLNRKAFAYGGGYGSVLALAPKGSGLKVTWTHCNMVEASPNVFQEYAEPFSFVVRSADTGLPAALDRYISPQHPYPGTPNPPAPVCVARP